MGVNNYNLLTFSAERNWLKDNCRSEAAVSVMASGKKKEVLQDFYKHLRFENAKLTDNDKLAFKIARGGKLVFF